ncbi:MAG: type I-U CRISPR-associated helicase/endonuclease Cas3, partial [Caulobacterales bacterium]|nr:type I-U CRISPR-associated helicase/endonuclease Cas3 [Caulobacterales bacterium]
DQATAEAEGLAEKLRPDAKNALAELRARLGVEGEAALPVSTLRGQFADNRTWLADPASPAIVVGTVDMIGSRLLFGGYRTSRWMRPVHAGLIGCDTLVVIDEAHLVPPFAHLFRAAADPDGVRQGDQAGPPGLHLMTLTATASGEAPGGGMTFGLSADDRKNARVQELLNAPKPLTFADEAESRNLAARLAEEAWALRTGDDGAHRRVLVYCNSRKVADETKKKIETLAQGDKKAGMPNVGIETELLVGARRVKEREDAQKALERLGFMSSKEPPEKPVFLVATSAGEVGIDLDADAMVCDLVAWERMVQRLGRVNRRGGEAPAPVVVVTEAARKDDEKARLDAYRAALSKLPKLSDSGHYDASVGAITALKEDKANATLLKAATTPEPLRPALTRPLIDAWAMTSLEEHPGRPEDLTPWLRGWIDDDAPQCEIVWRRWLPWRTSDDRPDPQEIARFFDAAPVHLTEILETPIGSASSGIAKWFVDGIKPLDEDRPDGHHAWRQRCALLFDRPGRLVGAASADDFRDDGKRKKFAGKMEAGCRLIVQADLGGLSGDGLLDARGDTPSATADSADGDDWARQVGWRVVSDGEAAEDPCWRPVFSLPGVRSESEDPPPGLRVEKFVGETAANADDKTAPEVTRRRQSLAEHSSWTEKEASQLAEKLGFDRAMTDIFRTAGWLHDAGKDRDNWQAFIRNEKGGEPLAKNTDRADPALLKIAGETYRHEFGSILDALHGTAPDRARPFADEAQARLAKLPEDSRDLALHLVASHHGRARPVIAAVDRGHDLTTCTDEARAAA